jgi:hypothetical protein
MSSDESPLSKVYFPHTVLSYFHRFARGSLYAKVPENCRQKFYISSFVYIEPKKRQKKAASAAVLSGDS